MNEKIERPTWGVKAIAELFNVKEATVWRWINKKSSEYHVLRQTIDGNKWYAYESEVDEFLRRPRAKAE